MKKQIKLLFVDDEQKFLEGMTKRLELRDLVVHSFSNGAEALEAVKKETYDVALIDLKMPSMNGEELLQKMREAVPAMEVVILTGHGSLDSATRTFRAGAYEYLMKPCGLNEILITITRAYAKRIKAKDKELRNQVNAIVAAAESCSPQEMLRMLQDLEEQDQ